MKEIVKVRQVDIDNSIHSLWNEANPLSIAMMDEWGSFHVVDMEKGTVVNTEIGRVYKLSKEASELVAKFKTREQIVPCEVEIEFIEQSLFRQFVKDIQ